jgi:TetR/AcrR family transcriptional repressor of nem operon
MARKKEFDQTEVLTKAMEIFWQQGFEATSVDDLVKRMGINRGSLYDTFEDKHTLFLAVIQHYDNTVINPFLSDLDNACTSGSAKQAIINFFHETVSISIAENQRRGCLVTNAAVELAPHDADAEKSIVNSLKRIESAFYVCLAKARQNREISNKHDLRSLARFLTSSLQGLRVMAKVNQDPKFLFDIVNTIVSVLD